MEHCILRFLNLSWRRKLTIQVRKVERKRLRKNISCCLDLSWCWRLFFGLREKQSFYLNFKFEIPIRHIKLFEILRLRKKQFDFNFAHISIRSIFQHEIRPRLCCFGIGSLSPRHCSGRMSKCLLWTWSMWPALYVLLRQELARLRLFIE